jgi:site-specific DNA-methyltransferase (adenine-specific)
VTPYYSGYGVTLFHADSRDILPALPSESIDLLLTDPPYGIKYRSKSQVLAPDLAKAIQGDEDLNAMRDVLGLVHPLLRPDRHAYLFAAPMRLGEAVAAVAAYWTVKNLLVWDKGNAGSRGDCLAGYSQNWEAIIYASKGRRPLNLPRPRCIFRYDWQGHRDPVHPTIKPRPLLRWLLQKSAQPGELVLDPFAGSGSSLLAAAELGMKAIGIETEERYCEVAARRLEQIRQ